MSTTTMVGFLAGFLTTISFLPQVVKTWKSRSASDLSLGMFSVFSVGGDVLAGLWVFNSRTSHHILEHGHPGFSFGYPYHETQV